ncbi:hypothetical protein BDW02DRAFT_631499 [Decorospora gaudefroyi]|uniref:Uncharacterized protein n=1 Tax=Decorospora gaudefroyi TaxID=184978 RepID=A0A6A5K5T2_9PLEO|nr:hypothetical protein BDW02DRAFT_631499 [Decorospora gaudefroyi]
MPPARRSRRKGASSSQKKKRAIHETASYPRIEVTPETNSCLIPSLHFEHVLRCGHLIATVEADEPCAPNCHHVANATLASEENNDTEKEFYCDACVEEEHELLIPKGKTCTEAEHSRATMREAAVESNEKATKYRKCYIGLKVTLVPCRKDGTPVSGYTPRTEHHPWDTSVPQMGDNVFEDMFGEVAPEAAAQERSAHTVAAPPVVPSPSSPLQGDKKRTIVELDDEDEGGDGQEGEEEEGPERPTKRRKAAATRAKKAKKAAEPTRRSARLAARKQVLA